MFEQIAAIEDRALDEDGQRFLKAVLKFRKMHIPPTPMRITRKERMSDRRVQEVARMLENAGFVMLTMKGTAEVKDIQLTSKGIAKLIELGADVPMVMT